MRRKILNLTNMHIQLEQYVLEPKGFLVLENENISNSLWKRLQALQRVGQLQILEYDVVEPLQENIQENIQESQVINNITEQEKVEPGTTSQVENVQEIEDVQEDKKRTRKTKKEEE